MNKIIIKKFVLLILGGIFFCAILFRFTPSLFPIKKYDIRRSSFHSVKFYDRNDNFLQEVLSQNSMRSVQSDIDQVSPYFLKAIVATEDKNFYKHCGIDYESVLRAIWNNTKYGRIISGASTITLQLARLIHPADRTILNKIKEAYFSLRIEAGMDKRSILEEYINRIPMGGNLYGVESAAMTYFGIPAKDLTLAQATFLASIPNSPNRLNPYFNLKEIKKRQKTVLNRMVALNMITLQRVDRIIKENISLKPQTANFLAPHFIFHLMKSINDTAQSVTTTIDAELQRMISEQITITLSRLQQYHVTNASVILLDNHTGEILAYIGSADYFNTQIDGQFDGIHALRQPGSTLKPFLYLLAMEQGFHPASLISDIPSHYSMPTGVYSPKNYSEDFHGPVRLREALANSLNVPAVRTLAKIGVDPFLRRLREYQFESLSEDSDYYGVGLALGGGEVSLFELTRAYLCLARNGNFQPVSEVKKINNEIISPRVGVKRISSPQYNFLITDILSDRFARAAEFGFHSILNLPFPCAAKTGTSFRFCDNWTIGFTRDYTLGVWVGNFDHTPMMKVSGVTGAGPLFAKIMLQLYSKKEYPGKFIAPERIYKVYICPLSGQKPHQYCPTRIEEYITAGDLEAYQKQLCEMHTKENNGISTAVPVKYADWANQLGVKTIQQPKSQTIFEIQNPKNGAVYKRLPNLNPEFQSIHIQLLSSEKFKKVKWYLNEQIIQTTSDDHSFLWSAKPGHFRLKAIPVGQENMSATVSFEVK